MKPTILIVENAVLDKMARSDKLIGLLPGLIPIRRRQQERGCRGCKGKSEERYLYQTVRTELARLTPTQAAIVKQYLGVDGLSLTFVSSSPGRTYTTINL